MSILTKENEINAERQVQKRTLPRFCEFLHEWGPVLIPTETEPAFHLSHILVCPLGKYLQQPTITCVTIITNFLTLKMYLSAVCQSVSQWYTLTSQKIWENLLRLWQNLSILSDMSVEFWQSLFRLALCVHFASTSGRIAAEPRPELMSQNYYYMTATKPGGIDFLCRSIIKTIQILKEGGGSGG